MAFESSRRNLTNLIVESFKNEKGEYQKDPIDVMQCVDLVFNDIENEVRALVRDAIIDEISRR